jgi:hypothetical protein
MSTIVCCSNDLPNDSWDNFVGESVNGTIFHTRRFLSYHPEERFRDESLVFRRAAKILVVAGGARTWTAGATAWSHRGASYGGFVYREGLRQ